MPLIRICSRSIGRSALLKSGRGEEREETWLVISDWSSSKSMDPSLESIRAVVRSRARSFVLGSDASRPGCWQRSEEHEMKREDETIMGLECGVWGLARTRSRIGALRDDNPLVSSWRFLSQDLGLFSSEKAGTRSRLGSLNEIISGQALRDDNPLVSSWRFLSQDLALFSSERT